MGPGPEVIKICSTQLNMRFFLLINVKMPTFMSRKNSVIVLQAAFPDILHLCVHAHEKYFITSGPEDTLHKYL